MTSSPLVHGDPARSRRPRLVIHLVIATIALFVAWSYFAPLNAVVRGTGRVEPRTAMQTIQNLEGGIVAEIFVREGDQVAQGDLLVVMEDTLYRSGVDELSGRATLLEMQIFRLAAEADATQAARLEFPADLVMQAPDAAQTEQALFSARITQLRMSVGVLQQILDSRQAELDLIEPMAARGAVAEADLIRARQAVLETERQIIELETSFEAARVQTLSELQAELAQVRQQLRVRAAQLERSEMRAPMAGIVNRVVVQTAGGVVAPGGPILEILPLDEAPVISGRIAPGDIGPVYVGMPANVKLTAYDYRDYGSLSGQVIHVSADTILDPQMAQPEPYFEITVALDRHSLIGRAGEVFVRPGMLADVELDAGRRTVFHYLFNPLLRAREAFTEPD